MLIFLRTLIFLFGIFGILPHSSAKTILVVGDSLSAAYGFERDLGWVNLLQKKLDLLSTHEKWQVVNASVSGETTSGGRARLPKLLIKHDPDICIIALGANDGLRGQLIEHMYTNLSIMITACTERATKTLLVGMRLPPNYGKKYTVKFQQCYEQLVEAYRPSFVPFMLAGIAEQLELFQADGLHPTSTAQPFILDNIWPEFFKLLTTN